MTCGCTNNKKLDRDIGNTLSLEIMRNMPIDEVINLYRQGYTLEGSEDFTNIRSLALSFPNIQYATAASGIPSAGKIRITWIWSNTGGYGYGQFKFYNAGTTTLIGTMPGCCYSPGPSQLYRLSTFDITSGVSALDIVTYKCNSDTQQSCPAGSDPGCTGTCSTIIEASRFSNIDALPYGTEKPSQPSTLTITPGNESLTLSWSAVSPPILGYHIVIKRGSTTMIDGYWSQHTGPVAITGLTNGASHVVSVSAISASNVEGTTKTGTGTPTAPCVGLTMTSVSCPSSPINQGSSGYINAFLTGGTGDLTYALYVDGYGPVSTYSTPERSHQFTHTFNETIGTHTYRVDVVDSCVPPNSATGSCTATIQAALGTITFNVTLAGSPLSGVAISVDDVPRDTTDVSGILAVPNLTIGVTHTYVATKTGYNTISGSTVLDTTAITVPISMTLTPPPEAISIVPNKTSCTSPCDVSVDITWRNNATDTTIFVPSMKVNDIPISPAQYPSQELVPDETTTKTFTLSGLTSGVYTMCPDPN